MVESKVAVLHSIGIEHGYDLEDEEFSQDGGGPSVAEEEVDQSFDEVGGGGLGGMDAGC